MVKTSVSFLPFLPTMGEMVFYTIKVQVVEGVESAERVKWCWFVYMSVRLEVGAIGRVKIMRPVQRRFC